MMCLRQLAACLVLAIWTTEPTLAQSPAPDRQARVMLEAAERGDVATINRVIIAGGKVNVRDEMNRTPLLLAVAGNHLEAFKVLLAEGADINAQANDSDTPWLLAGARGRTEMLRLMLDRKPDLTLRNRYGGNALIPACHYGHVDTVKLLLGTKIDLNQVNNLGWTCLLEAVLLGDGGRAHQEVVQLAIKAGANPNIADSKGVSPLAHARARGQTEIARLIAAAGGR
jgi:hypothetical protein